MAKAVAFVCILPLIISPRAEAQERASLAVVYYWKAKTGKLAEYNAYIKEYAEPIDEEARKSGAFISVTTFVSQRDSSQWTHMRVFMLKDSVQLQNLSAALQTAGIRLEPDEGRRRKRSEYSATLRDFVGQEVLKILD
jgi:hypothetical protein